MLIVFNSKKIKALKKALAKSQRESITDEISGHLYKRAYETQCKNAEALREQNRLLLISHANIMAAASDLKSTLISVLQKNITTIDGTKEIEAAIIRYRNIL